LTQRTRDGADGNATLQQADCERIAEPVQVCIRNSGFIEELLELLNSFCQYFTVDAGSPLPVQKMY